MAIGRKRYEPVPALAGWLAMAVLVEQVWEICVSCFVPTRYGCIEKE